MRRMSRHHPLQRHPERIEPAPPRLGPRPLGLHLMTGLCALLSLPAALPSLKSASPDLNPEKEAQRQKLIALLQSAPDPAFGAALGKETLTRARQFIAGMKAYRHHPARRDVPEAPVVWREGTTKLRDYHPSSPEAPAVLVIPSLINRFDILDLDFAPSFLRTLAAAGLRPLVVDWDEPGKAEMNFTLDDYMTERLVPILAWIAKGSGAGKSTGGSRPIHVVGYCMGGLLALALAALQAERVATLALMATPWDFHQPEPATAMLLAGIAEEWDSAFGAATSMPVDIIQSLFALLQPLQAVTKFVDFAALDPGSAEARQFVLLEDWLNDGVPLPAAVARACLKDWYGKNLTASFDWRVRARVVDPRELSMPAYVVVPGRDHIVPPESALPLARLLPRATLHEPMTGHIGMMASRQASQQVWKPFLHWLKEHA
jgi:polyhydroxyalkanoate synthase